MDKHEATLEQTFSLRLGSLISLSAILLVPVDRVRPELIMWDTCMCDWLQIPTVPSPHTPVLVQQRHHVLYTKLHIQMQLATLKNCYTYET